MLAKIRGILRDEERLGVFLTQERRPIELVAVTLAIAAIAPLGILMFGA